MQKEIKKTFWVGLFCGMFLIIIFHQNTFASRGYNNTADQTYSSVSGGNTRGVVDIYDWRAGTLLEDQ